MLLLFLGEAAALAVAGIAIGLGLARLLADAAVTMTASTVSTLYIAAVSAPPEMNIGHLWIGDRDRPAAVADRRRDSRARGEPRAADRRDARPRHARHAACASSRPRWSSPFVFLAVAYALAQLPPIGRRPVFGYMSSFAIVIGARVPGAGDHVWPRAARPDGRCGGGSASKGLLAHANLTSAIPRLSISVAALAVSLAMMVAIAVMIGSFRDTVVYWVGQTLQADLFIGPGIRPTVGSEQTVSEDVIATLAHASGRSTALDRFRNVDLVYEGNLAVLGAGSFDVVLDHGGLLFKSPANARDERARARSARTR